MRLKNIIHATTTTTPPPPPAAAAATATATATTTGVYFVDSPKSAANNGCQALKCTRWCSRVRQGGL